MSLVDSNRNRKNAEPKKKASLSDLNKHLQKNNVKSNSNNNSKDAKKGHKTTLTIDSKTKNKLQAMVLMGDAPTQKDGFEVAMGIYYDNLPDDRKSMFDILYNSLETRDNKK
ncbi:DUF5388 domain-containing protein [Apilactobacillus micheneri]|uniref:DUF5388 domain-containing protein n=1 Tax=Apilactobacillus micheneri TaxID=1899430 RepID=UPI00112ED14F|nr:DUF5388 domain-containing protein [Apilactobacillus micheneri]TPR50743.1 hypothetical protein DY126_06760 [Apilactobacillus micheneri]